jgi:CRP/FNR family cyclic AMP-dependent transcriptional regulator
VTLGIVVIKESVMGVDIMSDIEALRRMGEIVSISEDEILFQQGEKGDHAYLILKGKVAVILNSVYDGSDVVIAEIGEGDIVGEMAILEESPRAATVKAIGQVILLKIKEAQFLEFLKMNPKYTRGLLTSFSNRIITTREKISERMNLADGHK